MPSAKYKLIDTHVAMYVYTQLRTYTAIFIAMLTYVHMHTIGSIHICSRCLHIVCNHAHSYNCTFYIPVSKEVAE